MATGMLHAEIDVKSHADKFWASLKDFIHIYPKAFPHNYESVEVLEGDGIQPGSVRLVKYGEGSLIVKVSKEKVEVVDDPKKIFGFSVIDGDLLKYYKSFKSSVQVVPKDEGSLLKWSCEYEKTADDIPDPTVVKDFAVKSFKELDDYIANQA
ncbi:MLP-like protein 423 [Humulus lupulus]|uniref:MLP-like protein 423 n=1 Tax=Humulus lupulus TaxID=3486 RepID=UPI002B40854A|nr:MLP-like protein 423 [Humulus lupulus]